MNLFESLSLTSSQLHIISAVFGKTARLSPLQEKNKSVWPTELYTRRMLTPDISEGVKICHDLTWHDLSNLVQKDEQSQAFLSHCVLTPVEFGAIFMTWLDGWSGAKQKEAAGQFCSST